ncbi:DUF4230 domain-containing protein [[Clostridium] aminophilum]|uniref:DUF4230 domain-containing protein n=1 Tax=[Clostridium] aminophilum TaxID=1526 RepID=A0A1I6JQL4_9FIRM|nr:DUF4230 domain-containing protein [[Clostridium] aminophilum]SFR81265.1 Protein of unknown function [[Clostridium] aminophilum]
MKTFFKCFFVCVLSAALTFSLGMKFFSIARNAGWLKEVTAASLDDDSAKEKYEIEKDLTASFQEAIVDAPIREKNLVVCTRKVDHIMKLVDDGFFMEIGKKAQLVRYAGVASYSVDLGGLCEQNVSVDEDRKVVTIEVPKPVMDIRLNEADTKQSETIHGVLAFGDPKLSEEESSTLRCKVLTDMEKTLEEENSQADAERFAKLSVWEIYQRVVSSVSPEYTVDVKISAH